MKRRLVTYVDPPSGEDRLGLLFDDHVVDLNRAYASVLAAQGEPRVRERAAFELPRSMLEFLQAGSVAIIALDAVVAWLKGYTGQAERIVGAFGERASHPLAAVRLRAPVPRPGKIIHTAGNFREHAREGKDGGWDFQIPPWISFLKCTSSIIGPGDDVIYPRITEKLDHEIELAIVIGRGGRYIPAESAWEHVAGFTVFNDVTARDVQRREMKSGLLNLGKNLDTFAVFGPCMTLRDDIGDVHDLKIELRVNGDPRQVSSTAKLAVKVPEIVSHWSVMRLEPGDIISTGTVSGVGGGPPPPRRRTGSSPATSSSARSRTSAA
jgi:2-keto-4-pentenoate hydratase/2-oxohepta-3-ene-1,7-dioic acid hydratase in catechol pathway